MTFFFFRHKEQAPHKYMQLEQKLRNDERLSEFFWVLVFDQTFRPVLWQLGGAVRPEILPL